MKKILIVDDQPNIRRLLDISLQSEDRRILLAESGESALEVVSEQKPDLLIVDLVMPGGMDGFEMIEAIRSDPGIRLNYPVLILTARDRQVDRERAERLGVEGFLTKPFDVEVLQGKVAEILAKG